MTAQDINDWAGLVTKIVAERVLPDDRDDARQEALLAVWLKLEEVPDIEPWLVGLTARRAIAKWLDRGKSATGTPRRTFGAGGERQRDNASRHCSLEAVLDAYAQHGSDVPDEILEADFSDDTDLRVSVRGALCKLDPADREQMFAQFWNEETSEPYGRRIGVSGRMLRKRFTNHIAPALREALEDAA